MQGSGHGRKGRLRLQGRDGARRGPRTVRGPRLVHLVRGLMHVALRIAPVLCGCGVSEAESVRLPATPIEVVLNDGWLVLPGGVWLGPHQGEPPLLFTRDDLTPSSLVTRVRGELDRYPPRVLRGVLDRVVIGTQLSVEGTSLLDVELGGTSPSERAVLMSAEYMTERKMPRTLHHEIGHVLQLLLHDDTRKRWAEMSEAGDRASNLGARS